MKEEKQTTSSLLLFWIDLLGRFRQKRRPELKKSASTLHFILIILQMCKNSDKLIMEIYCTFTPRFRVRRIYEKTLKKITTDKEDNNSNPTKLH